MQGTGQAEDEQADAIPLHLFPGIKGIKAVGNISLSAAVIQDISGNRSS